MKIDSTFNLWLKGHFLFYDLIEVAVHDWLIKELTDRKSQILMFKDPILQPSFTFYLLSSKTSMDDQKAAY